jgi:hypothetical protein
MAGDGVTGDASWQLGYRRGASYRTPAKSAVYNLRHPGALHASPAAMTHRFCIVAIVATSALLFGPSSTARAGKGDPPKQTTVDPDGKQGSEAPTYLHRLAERLPRGAKRWLQNSLEGKSWRRRRGGPPPPAAPAAGAMTRLLPARLRAKNPLHGLTEVLRAALTGHPVGTAFEVPPLAQPAVAPIMMIGRIFFGGSPQANGVAPRASRASGVLHAGSNQAPTPQPRDESRPTKQGHLFTGGNPRRFSTPHPPHRPILRKVRGK